MKIILTSMLVALMTVVAWPCVADEPAAGQFQGNSVLWQELKGKSPQAKVVRWEGWEEASRIDGLKWSSAKSGDAETVAREFLERFGTLLGVTSGGVRRTRVEKTATRSAVRYQQMYGDMRVLGAQVVVLLDSHNRVRSVSSSVLPGLSVTNAGTDVGATTAGLAAFKRVLGEAAGAHAPADEQVWESLARKAVLVSGTRGLIVYRVVVPTVPGVEKIVCLVDAATGEIVKAGNEVIR